MPDELLDAHRHVEELVEDGRQAVRIPHVPRERADVEELRRVGQPVTVPERRGRHAR